MHDNKWMKNQSLKLKYRMIIQLTTNVRHKLININYTDQGSLIIIANTKDPQYVNWGSLRQRYPYSASIKLNCLRDRTEWTDIVAELLHQHGSVLVA